jgi:hypothetical protein
MNGHGGRAENDHQIDADFIEGCHYDTNSQYAGTAVPSTPRYG